jgi:hypothetical protein
MGTKIDVYKVLVGKFKEKVFFRRLKRRWKNNNKIYVKIQDVVDLSGSG